MKHSLSKISVLQRDLGVRKQGRVQICAAGPKNGTRKIQKSYFYSAILDDENSDVQICPAGSKNVMEIFKILFLQRDLASS